MGIKNAAVFWEREIDNKNIIESFSRFSVFFRKN